MHGDGLARPGTDSITHLEIDVLQAGSGSNFSSGLSSAVGDHVGYRRDGDNDYQYDCADSQIPALYALRMRNGG